MLGPSRAQRGMFAVAWLVLAALLFVGFLLVLFVPTIYGDSQYSLWADLRRMGLGASGEPGAFLRRQAVVATVVLAFSGASVVALSHLSLGRSHPDADLARSLRP